MKKIFLLLWLSAACALYGQGGFHYQTDFPKILAQTQDRGNPLAYEGLLKRFNANDTTMTDFEVLALLIGYTAQPAYHPYQDINTEREIYRLNGEKKYEEALEKGFAFLKTHPVSLSVLFEIAYSYHKQGDSEHWKYYRYRGRRILEAMYFSGKGISITEPTFALGPADGQDYIYKFVDAKIGTMGSGSDPDGNFIDMLEAKFEDGRSLQMYFIIEHATQKMFSTSDNKKIDKALKKAK